MATSFIRIEPSCDIHLVLDHAAQTPLGNPLSQLTLNVFYATESTYMGTDIFQYTNVSSDILIDSYPNAQQTVVIGAPNVLTANQAGTAFLRVLYTDPTDNSTYHYVIVRVMVHQTLNTWWFGNKNLSVFIDEDYAHSQPSLYATFDAAAPGGPVVGDITGHDFVQLTSQNPDIFVVASDAERPYTGRIRGVQEGAGKLTGVLMGTTLQLDVTAVDIGKISNPVLQRNQVDATVSPRQRHNLLFVYEGFTDPSVVDNLNKEIVHELFGSERHSPFNLLADDINVWSVFPTSAEATITTGFRVTGHGFPFPYYDQADSETTPDGLYSLKKLTHLVGLSTQTMDDRGITPTSTPQDVTQLVNQQIQTWTNNPPPGFDAHNIPGSDTIQAWMNQVPLNRLPQAVNSYYGFVAGTRPGEQVSILSGDAPVQPNTPAFTELINQWYDPYVSNKSFLAAVDFRRWAPDIYQPGTERWKDYLIRRHIAQFNEQMSPPIDPGYLVGQSWDVRNAPAPDSTDVNSAGLVCFVINYPLEGRAVSSRQRFIGLFAGNAYNFFQTDKTQTPNTAVFNETTSGGTVQLNIQPVVLPDYPRMVAILAHELGHGFALGDEYEEAGAYDAQTAQTQAETFDNLVAYQDVSPASVPIIANPQYEGPINAPDIPWAALHRILYAFTIVAAATSTDGKTVTVTLSPADIKRLNGIRGPKLYIRRMIINTKETLEDEHWKQLRTKASDIQANDIFTELDMVGDPNVAASTVTLTATANTKPATLPSSLIPPGSILYIPKRDAQTDTPLSLIETPVMNFMTTAKYDNSPFEGRALSVNYNGSTHAYNGVKSDPDEPVSIPGWKGPCKGFTMIGLYEGGARMIGGVFRPAGGCKMRDEYKTDIQGQYCFVCKYLLVSRVNPSKLGDLDKEYPSSKGNKWQNLLNAFGGLDTSGIK